MKTPARLAALFAATLALQALAQGPATLVDPLTDWRNTSERDHDAPLSDFHLINYFFSRFSFTNQVGDPTGLRGVSLGPIGEGAGSSVRVGNNNTAYAEQRWIPVIEYSPWFFDDLITFRSQFEIDFMWGLGANAAQQNSGGGFNADMINVQTKNVNVALYPTRKPSQLAIIIGTQCFYDNVLDPTRTSVFDIVRSGYKLAFLGSDGTGAQVFWQPIQGLRTRAGLLMIGAAQPDKATKDDPRLAFAWMGLLDATYEIQPGTHIGASAWLLHDDTKGYAYAFEGLVASGPSSSGLYNYTGTAKLPIERPTGNVGYGGLNFNHNLNFNTGPFAASGFFVLNGGKYVSGNPNTTFQKEINILGWAANLELILNYGRTINDVISLEGMYSTGDGNPNNNYYAGAYTLNFYGLPGAVWFNHKTLLLFPFSSTVNNYTGAVSDISNQGLGVSAAILAAQYDLVPNTLNLKVGAAMASANADPPVLTAGVTPGRFMGTEINAELRWTIRYLMTVGLHGAYMFKGSFYDGNPHVTANPYALFTTFTWYGF